MTNKKKTQKTAGRNPRPASSAPSDPARGPAAATNIDNGELNSGDHCPPKAAQLLSCAVDTDTSSDDVRVANLEPISTVAIQSDRSTLEEALRTLDLQDEDQTDPRAPVENYKHDPTFLGLPRELRNLVYGHLLTIDRGPELTLNPHRWEENFGNLSILRVSHQVRAEAWDVLKSTNIIVHVTVFTEANQPVKPNLMHGAEDHLHVQPYIQAGLFGLVKAEELNTSSALHIWLGESCGKDDANKTGRYRMQHNMMFVYSMRTYGFFCIELAARVNEYKSISIDVNPCPSAAPFEFILQELLLPLSIIRGADRVCFRNLMKIKIFANMGKEMMKRIHCPEEMTKTLTLFKDKGNECYKAGKYAVAICHYWLGGQALGHLLEQAEKHDWPVGSPGINGIYHVEADLNSNCAQAHHKLVLSRKGKNGKFRNIEGWQLDKAINFADAALAWAGVLDDQRGKAHFRRGVAFMDKAQYLIQFLGKLSQRELEQTKWSNATHCYGQAALDFYCAMQVAFKGKDMKILQSLYDQCRLKGDLSGDPELHEEVVAGIGLWKGDPRLFRNWRSWHMEFYMMYMLRQRASDEPVPEDEMKAVYERAGIRWRHAAGGVLKVHFVSR
ncbi:hypothetical protein H2200_002196 [Cladophialophora chaetospira]|uniref:Uncharacterized protein n=1 Tax=Cladophialophora chaetospira TaxID=386627 RepID=A0AA39CNA7_9EURO|nr:hypothetical protein H2200_002196 [Cladophialophora chaetospira]